MEYNEFAKGATTITEIDFARILLRYTFLHTEEYELILERYFYLLINVVTPMPLTVYVLAIKYPLNILFGSS